MKLLKIIGTVLISLLSFALIGIIVISLVIFLSLRSCKIEKEKKEAAQTVYFLKDINLDQDKYSLIIHPEASGRQHALIVTDKEVLREAQEHIFFHINAAARKQAKWDSFWSWGGGSYKNSHAVFSIVKNNAISKTYRVLRVPNSEHKHEYNIPFDLSGNTFKIKEIKENYNNFEDYSLAIKTVKNDSNAFFKSLPIPTEKQKYGGRFTLELPSVIQPNSSRGKKKLKAWYAKKVLDAVKAIAPDSDISYVNLQNNYSVSAENEIPIQLENVEVPEDVQLPIMMTGYTLYSSRVSVAATKKGWEMVNENIKNIPPNTNEYLPDFWDSVQTLTNSIVEDCQNCANIAYNNYSNTAQLSPYYDADYDLNYYEIVMD